MLLQLLVCQEVKHMYVSHTMSHLWFRYTASDIWFHWRNVVFTVIKPDRSHHNICPCFTDRLGQRNSLRRLSHTHTHTNDIHQSTYQTHIQWCNYRFCPPGKNLHHAPHSSWTRYAAAPKLCHCHCSVETHSLPWLLGPCMTKFSSPQVNALKLCHCPRDIIIY